MHYLVRNKRYDLILPSMNQILVLLVGTHYYGQLQDAISL